MHRVLRLLIALLCICSGKSLHSQTTTPEYVLVVGGAGFIGSHVNEMLHQSGYQTIVLDNLKQGYREAVQHGIFIEGEIGDDAILDQIFTNYTIKAVMHFAALKDVGESVAQPLKYYLNNIATTLTLLDAMQRYGIKIFIFSSSAAIFGTPQEEYIDEDHFCQPLSPYGRSKLILETILPDLDHAYGLRYCALRYFNAAGGDPTGKRKNYNTTESNLIPVVLRSLQQGRAITVFGTDYPTADGTCVRDYVHVEDLGSAHIAAMERLLAGAPSGYYNLGNGKGFSVLEVIRAVEQVTGNSLRVIYGPRRPGDAAVVVASAAKAKQELGWQPRYPSLIPMIEHAWQSMNSPSEQDSYSGG